jgi:hypothetical protein
MFKLRETALSAHNRFDLGGKSAYGHCLGMPALPLVQLWIWISAFATLTGWTLSVFGQLNRAGYAVALALFASFLFFQRKNPALAGIKNFRHQKMFRRFHRPWPLCFGLLALLVFVGGALYSPDNYTAMTYRFPRILQWLAHGHWFWIHTTNYRMNDRACGIEWLSAPFLLFNGLERAVFLLNFVPFLLMPGLIFSIFTRLGIHPRVAWQWMWLLPSGYNFLLQAGSAANDTFPTLYALAAVDFALRARQSKSSADATASILAAALLTGAKASNLPLLLPWAIVLAASRWWRGTSATFLPRFIHHLILFLITAVISFLPSAILNTIYCHDWSGAVLEEPNMAAPNPFYAFVGNVFQILLQNLCPPFFPPARWWNAHAAQVVPQALVSISHSFIMGFFDLGELPTEDSAGIGLGLCMLLAISLVAKFSFAQLPGSVPALDAGEKKLRFCILIAPWIALWFYCVKSGMNTAARLISPYYPLLVPLLLKGPGALQLIRRRWWRVLVLINFVFAFAILILTPSRPLWPARIVLSYLAERHPGSPMLLRAQEVYTLYSQRYDPLAGLRGLLPQNVSVVGFAAGTDDAEISLWLPLGSRRVEDFLLTDSPAELRNRGIEYAVINDGQLPRGRATLDAWLAQSGAALLATTNATLKIATGPVNYYVVRLKP